MSTRRALALLLAFLPCALCARPAHASFHIMQIEQVIGGVNGDASAQAIQLRMRATGENLVSFGRLRAWDAAGANPVLLLDLATNVANGTAGDQVLIVTSAFQSAVSPVVTPDFVMTTPIPASYLAAGSLTWESDGGIIYWRVSWGGASYTGAGTVSTLNDADGNANPPFAGALPHTTFQSLKFSGAAAALSTNNAADYAVTAGASVWTNNGHASETVVGNSSGVPPGAVASEVHLSAPFPNPTTGNMSFRVTLDRETRVRVAVYGVGGQLVRTVADRTLSAGDHGFAWDGRGASGGPAANGMYYLRLDAGGLTQAKKFLLLR